MASRKMSTISTERLATLEDLQAQFDEMSSMVDEFQGTIEGGASEPEELLAIKSQLAQLNGKLDRFQFESVDAVATGDLSSGKSDAKAMRKALNAGVDVLRERVTALHSAL
mmetsp:Transcript_53243/g.147593  ORF Transcript_53243/g.147593 Transcript_53243/m.147593 type:complete len:111 (-) Transcript_53243:282-614(-)|eukprot:CAMPEP_0119519070 /NCGR_PEP_ID=MMETSP1344-20130328/35494_1 /TAXON_ID=236787 /ORGANISM="Florenciella parvula, Strain CCMP2471" /LENGTH=110 /DNA_ID=CAMNT_0007556805 /DNA_START=132 /DNA_END=464 /DNA_ORIENTATION=-